MTSETEKARRKPKEMEAIPGSTVVITFDISADMPKGMRGIVIGKMPETEEAVMVSLENNKTRFFYDFEIVVID
jgi:hypothetical protein